MLSEQTVLNIQKSVLTCIKEGVACVPQLFTQEEIARLRAESLLSLLEKPQVEVINGFPTIMYNPPSDYMQKLSYDERIMTVARQHIKGEFSLETQQYYFHLPGDPDEFAWHTDERFRPGEEDKYIQTAILVDDWTEENSAVEFCKGSHKKPFENGGNLRKFIRGDRRGEKVLAKSGDLLIWSNMVVHGSERNQANYPRAYYMLGYKQLGE